MDDTSYTGQPKEIYAWQPHLLGDRSLAVILEHALAVQCLFFSKFFYKKVLDGTVASSQGCVSNPMAIYLNAQQVILVLKLAPLRLW